jgi:hypothetical protein
MAEKFVWRVKDSYRLPRRKNQAFLPLLHAWDLLRQRFQIWFSKRALEAGFTNALDHDRDPPFQSYVEVSMEPDAVGYRISFTARDTHGAEIDRLTLEAGSSDEARPPAPTPSRGVLPQAAGSGADARLVVDQ